MEEGINYTYIQSNFLFYCVDEQSLQPLDQFLLFKEKKNQSLVDKIMSVQQDESKKCMLPEELML